MKNNEFHFDIKDNEFHFDKKDNELHIGIKDNGFHIDIDKLARLTVIWICEFENLRNQSVRNTHTKLLLLPLQCC